MNPLEEYPLIRRWAYRAVWLAGLFLGATQAWFAATDSGSPPWLAPGLAVVAYVSVATNYTADRNVTVPTPTDGEAGP